MGGSSSSSTQASNTYNTDRRITTGSGQIVNLSDNVVSGSNNKINLTSADPQVAMYAINAVGQIAGAGLGAATALAAGSNEIARQVADSQSKFVETATGQKTILYVVGGLMVGGLGLVLLLNRKK